MGVGVSLSSLASSVAAEGGIGVISAAHIGFSLPDFEDNPIKANLQTLGDHIRAAKEKAEAALALSRKILRKKAIMTYSFPTS